MEKPTKKRRRKGLSTCVVFTEEEMIRLKTESDNLNKSIPVLLKQSFFKGIPNKVLMRSNDLDRFMGQVGRIGNNLNQIARVANGGLSHGWNEKSVNEIKNMIEELVSHVRYGYGIHQN